MRSPYSISTHAFYFLLGSGVVFQSLPGISSDDMSPPACAHSPALELSPVPTAPAQAPSLPPGPGARCLSDPEGQAASWLTAGGQLAHGRNLVCTGPGAATRGCCAFAFLPSSLAAPPSFISGRASNTF